MESVGAVETGLQWWPRKSIGAMQADVLNDEYP